MAQGEGRYQIPGEPDAPKLQGAVPSPFWMLPIAIFLALSYSLWFFLLPGLIGFLIGGRHRWRDPLLALLSVGIFIATGIGLGLWQLSGLEGLGLYYAHDLRLALSVLPLLVVVMGQMQTQQLRMAAAL
jgi:hypothetical protein